MVDSIVNSVDNSLVNSIAYSVDDSIGLQLCFDSASVVSIIIYQDPV
jgi:hypothetical protein